ncbi:MAG: hypothetical protein ACRD3M_04985 [Thermoanaerobaculia bacterium]
MGGKTWRVITLRGVPPEVARVIERRRAETGESLNRVVLELLEVGAGTRKRRKRVLHHDLDGLSGSWSREEARVFERALRHARKVDPELWK